MMIGKTIAHYQILGKLGEGGMGVVYKARDNHLDRLVALKVLPPEKVADPERKRRFVQEAKAASALNHPNIITIYGIDQVDSVHFIASEFIDGQTLRERMRKEPLKLGQALDLAVQISSALSAAHAAGIIHRDIKPDNIMLRRDGIVKVLDFGLAKLTEPPPAQMVDTEAPTRAVVKTEPGVVLGTTIYMSPEQSRGLALDERTDIFSLGVVLYQMVAGRLPYEGKTTTEVLAEIISEHEPPPLARYSREVPVELERIVSKALRKDRGERYQTIKDLLLDLQSLKQALEFEKKLERSMSQKSETFTDKREQASTIGVRTTTGIRGATIVT
jgi:serine/threonine protein kinase